MGDSALPAHAVAPDHAAWVQRVTQCQGAINPLFYEPAGEATDWTDDWLFCAHLLRRLNDHGMRAVLTPEDRERVARIERGVR